MIGEIELSDVAENLFRIGKSKLRTIDRFMTNLKVGNKTWKVTFNVLR